MAKDRLTTIANEKKRQTPVIDTTTNGDYMALLNPNSYEKGGWVLHMLRRRIGDSLFWKGISTYYTTYRNKNASSEDFEKVIESVSGQDLHTFFHQWLYTPGHPHVRIDWKYDPDKKAAIIDFTQTQDQLFDFPLEYSAGGNLYHVDIHDKNTHVELPLPERLTKLTPDPNCNLLASFEVVKP
jgi:aminopeptidase N